MTATDNRYSRQVAFMGLGEEGQQRLAESSVLVAGLGALGGTLAQLMVRAGVGRVRVVDHDRVSLDNLHRQLLYDEGDAEQAVLKAETGGRNLKAMNRLVKIDAVTAELSADNILNLMADVDLVLDGLDNFPARLQINTAAVKLQKPWIYAGVLGSGGNVMVIRPGRTPCLRCIFPDVNPDDSLPGTETAGILGPVSAFAASFSANEALKYLSGSPDKCLTGMMRFDLWQNDFEVIPFEKNSKDCICSPSREAV